MVDIDTSFLNDLDRIATQNYTPSDDDVVRARLRTVGVQEHQFIFEEGACVLPSLFDGARD